PESGGDLDPAGEISEWNPEEAGCHGRAWLEVHGHDPMSDPRFEPLLEEVWRMQEEVRRDPEVTALTEAWVACMADAGHSHDEMTDPDSASVPFLLRSNEIYGSVDFGRTEAEA